MAMVVPKKSAAMTLNSSDGLRHLAFIWNGDAWLHPKRTPFVMLTTPVSFIHRLMQAKSCCDLGCLLLDEFHNPDAWNLFLLLLFITFKRRDDPRVRKMKCLLLTATWMGPTVTAAEKYLEDNDIHLPAVEVKRHDQHFQPTTLWDVVKRPDGWTDMNMYDRTVLALQRMSEWIWNAWGESAIALILAPCDKEVSFNSYN